MAFPMKSLLTEESEVITDCDDLNDFQGHERTLLLIETDDQDIIMIGCKTIYDIAYYAALSQCLGKYEDLIDEWFLLKIKILDPENLPYENDFGSVYILHGDDTMYQCNTIKEATKIIEDAFHWRWATDISEFAVISGLELRQSMKLRLKGFLKTFNQLILDGDLK